MQVKYDVPISALTTFQNQGVIKTVYTAQTPAELTQFLAQNMPFCVLGKGSNVLLSPALESPILQVSPSWCEPQKNENHLHLSAGTPVHTLMKLCQEMGLSGMEFSAGVPASLGGMVAMNFGCWGQEMSQVVDRVLVFWATGKSEWLGVNDLEFGYRTSLFHRQKGIITEVVLSLSPTDPEQVRQTARSFIDQRNAKQPLRAKTFGSTFKNPPQGYAGAIIEALGLKGKPEGGVMFSPKHANFMENFGSGTFEDALKLIQTVRQQTQLEMEVQILQ
jgi:UDP-N-acetylmuramate dehydrogenase